MDFEFEKRWNTLVEYLATKFGEEIDIEAMLFLIGIQELGMGGRRFRKDEKLDLIHIGICTVLTPYGYYNFSHSDEEGWPHFECLKKLPHLKDAEQKMLMRKAVIEYFENEGLIQ